MWLDLNFPSPTHNKMFLIFIPPTTYGGMVVGHNRVELLLQVYKTCALTVELMSYIWQSCQDLNLFSHTLSTIYLGNRGVLTFAIDQIVTYFHIRPYIGAPDRNRTCNILITNQSLYQLRYGSIKHHLCLADGLPKSTRYS